MELIRLLIMAVALGADAFSLSLALGTRKLRKKVILKLTLLIGFCHVFMSFLGISLGYGVNILFERIYYSTTIDKAGKIIGAGVLMILGMIMIHDYYTASNTKEEINLYGPALFALSLSVSFDALSAGVGMGLLPIYGISACFLLGFVTSSMVLGGLALGSRLGTSLDWAELLGGGMLILLGIKFILSAG